MSTFEAWCSPTDLTDYADHTFVYCADNGKYFGCWAGGSIHAANSVKISSASYGGAYGVANCYRNPLTANGRTFPDTAGIGIYGVNGVCHQTTNLFMYAVTNQPMMTRSASGYSLGRPAGMVASYVTYGAWGAVSPGGLSITHWAAWYPAQYARCRNSSAEHAFAVVQDPDVAALGEVEILVQEFAAFVNIQGGIPLSESLLGQQRAFLQEKQDLLSADYDGQSCVIGENLAERVNDLSVEFQKILEERVGAQRYEELMAVPAGTRIRIVDPRIAAGVPAVVPTVVGA